MESHPEPPWTTDGDRERGWVVKSRGETLSDREPELPERDRETEHLLTSLQSRHTLLLPCGPISLMEPWRSWCVDGGCAVLYCL